MKKVLLAVLLICSTHVNARTLEEQSFVCVMKSYYNQLVEAVLHKDKHAIKYLTTDTRCIVTNRAVPVTIIDDTWPDGIVKVRLYVNGKTAEVWTNKAWIK